MGRKVSTCVASVALFLGSMGIYVVPFQVGALMDGLGLSATHSGFLGTLEIGAMALTAMAVAPLLGYRPPGQMAVVGGLLAIAGDLLTAALASPGALAGARLLTGVGSGVIYGAVNAAVARSDDPDRLYARGLALMNLAFLVLFLVLPQVIGSGGHRGLFLLLAAVIGVLLPLVRTLSVDPGTRRTGATPGTGAMRWRLVLLHFLGTISINLGLGALWGFVERIGLNVGMSTAQVGLALSATSLAMIGGCLLAAWLGARAGRLLPLVLGTVVAGVAALSVGLATTPAVYIVALMISEAAYLFLGAYIIAGVTSALDDSGRVAAACGGVMFLSYSAGIGAGGWIVDTWSLAGIGWFALAGCLAAAPLYGVVARQLDRR